MKRAIPLKKGSFTYDVITEARGGGGGGGGGAGRFQMIT